MGQCHSTSSLAHTHPCSISITVTHIPPTNELENILYESDRIDRFARQLRRVPQSSCRLSRSGRPIRAHYAHVTISDQRTNPDLVSRIKELPRSVLLHTDLSTPGSRRISTLRRCERLTIPLIFLRDHNRAIDPPCPNHPCRISRPRQLQPRLSSTGDCIVVDDQIRRAIALPLPLNHLDRPFLSDPETPREPEEICITKACPPIPTRPQWNLSDIEARYGRAMEYISTLTLKKRKNDDPDDGWLWIQW